MYCFACDINFASFYDLSTEFWQCSANMVFFFIVLLLYCFTTDYGV